MDFQDCIKFANETHLCFLATAEGDQPRVRPLGLWFADESGFYFWSESVKRFLKQIKDNSKVELCFLVQREMKMLRVSGDVEFLDDIAIRKRCFEEMSKLLKMSGIEKPEDPLLVIFRISHGEAYFWTLQDRMKESEIERIKF